MENFIIGFSQILSVETLAILLLGLCLGILFGATPGLSTSMGMAFMLALRAWMSSVWALIFWHFRQRLNGSALCLHNSHFILPSSSHIDCIAIASHRHARANLSQKSYFRYYKFI